MLEELLPKLRLELPEELPPKVRVGALEDEGRLPLKLLDEGLLGVVVTPVEGLLGVVFMPDEGADGRLGVVFTPEDGRLGRSDDERLPLKRPLPLRLLS